MIGIIASVERLQNSKNGNPRQRITLKEGGTYTTAPDANIGGMITNAEFGRVPVSFTLNSQGQITQATPLPWQVFRDGKPVSEPLASENTAFSWLLHHHGMSTNWAIKHEGYSIQNMRNK